MNIDQAQLTDAGRGASGAALIGPASAAAARARDWALALRLHQWAKNLIIFVPLFLGHIIGDGAAWTRTVVGFVAFCLVASGTYVVNDLLDLEFDRVHATKRHRPIAAGRIGVPQAGFAACAFLAAGGVAAWALSPPFATVVALYVGLTLAYSLRLKREPLIDVASIGALFTLRLLMGAVLNALTPSPWMLSFSALFFFSLALAKRHAELMRSRVGGGDAVAGRGYRAEDWPLTLAFGVAAGFASIVIMMLFVALDAPISGAYGSPRALFVAPACVSLWLMRIWLFSHRMTLDDDPVLFAFKDWLSYALGAVTLVGFVFAL